MDVNHLCGCWEPRSSSRVEIAVNCVIISPDPFTTSFKAREAWWEANRRSSSSYQPKNAASSTREMVGSVASMVPSTTKGNCALLIPSLKWPAEPLGFVQHTGYFGVQCENGGNRLYCTFKEIVMYVLGMIFAYVMLFRPCC